MRAKIMLLSSTLRDEQNARYALRILTDISAAFNHTLSVLQDKIGEKSLQACGEALSDKVISACQDCQAVFVCDGACPGLDELYDALDIPLSLRSLSVPEALCGRGESPVSLYVGTVLSLDEETLRLALRQAFLIAQEADMLLRHTAPSGASRDVWNAAVRLQETLLPQVSTVAQTAPEAVREMILSPQRAGFVLCPPYAGSILLAAGTALCAHPGVIHDMALGEGADVYAAHGCSMDEYYGYLRAALEREPDLVLDDGGDTTEMLHIPAAQKAPLRRCASIEDCANAVLFLASDAARCITGQVIAVDGGEAMIE